MKTLTKSLVKTESNTLRDAFIVLLCLSVIIGTVVALDYFHLIKEYAW